MHIDSINSSNNSIYSNNHISFQAINYARTQPSRTEETKPEEPPLTPPGGPLTTIGEDGITQTPEDRKDSEDDEVVQTQKRKRTLTQRLSAVWKRRSTKAKSRSPDKLVRGRGNMMIT